MNSGVPNFSVSVKGQYIVQAVLQYYIYVSLKFEFIIINRIFQGLTFLSPAV